MYTIIGADQKEYGPVAAEQLCQWIADGRANGATRARLEGSAEWKTLADFPDFAVVLAAKVGPPPVVVGVVETSIEEILNRDDSLNIASCLTRSFALFQHNFLLLAGATILVKFIIILGSMLGILIPFIGGFLASALGGVLNAGLFWLFMLRVRGQEAGVGDAFAGFSRNGLQLMLAALVVGVLSGIGFLCCLLPFIYLWVAWMFTLPIAVDRQMDFWPAMELGRKVATKHWWGLFALMIVAGLIAMVIPVLFGIGSLLLGGAALSPLISESISAAKVPAEFAGLVIPTVLFFLGFGIGFVVSAPFTMPISMGAVVYAYEDLFGTKPRPTA